ncbi:hypothetical protein F5Y03DRAFT_354361 [Xylaria venustula]|nr:hypothetical protein F5Y03DRAFT_354361 [Xylaria venustula]
MRRKRFGPTLTLRMTLVLSRLSPAKSQMLRLVMISVTNVEVKTLKQCNPNFRVQSNTPEKVHEFHLGLHLPLFRLAT